MLQTVRITSKRQITIPVKIFNQMGLIKGDQLVLEYSNENIIMKKSQQLLDEVAGIIIPPKKYQNKSIDFIIRDAKREYFTNKR